MEIIFLRCWLAVRITWDDVLRKTSAIIKPKIK
jgi:hypothetical protein